MQILIAQFPTKKERDKMWRFLVARDFSVLRDDDGPVFLEKGEDAGFGAREGGKRIVIRSATMPQKAWAVMSWIAHHSSFRQDPYEGGILRFEDEEIPVVPSTKLHGEDVIFVDDLGVMRAHTPTRGRDIQAQNDLLARMSEAYVPSKT